MVLDKNIAEKINDNYKKPPLGLMPKFISIDMYRSNRIGDILDAMERYSNDNIAIPVEWVIELRELLSTGIMSNDDNADNWWKKYRLSECDI